MHVSLVEYLLLFGAVIVGATVQGSVGFGQNLIVVPVAALILPESLPGAFVVAGVPITAMMAIREHQGIDRRGLAWMTVGRVPGTVVGLVIVAVVSADALGAVAGIFVLLAVGASALAPPLSVTPTAALGAGGVAGAFGTAAAIDGPPMALLYQHHPGPTLRSTLAAAFVVGTVMSLAGLIATGELLGWQVLLAFALLPGVAIGFAISRPVTRALHGRNLRPAVLVIAGLTGAAAVIRAVL